MAQLTSRLNDLTARVDDLTARMNDLVEQHRKLEQRWNDTSASTATAGSRSRGQLSVVALTIHSIAG